MRYTYSVVVEKKNLKTLGCYISSRSPWGRASLSLGSRCQHRNTIHRFIRLRRGAGAIFSNFYSVAPICTPVRGLAGTYPNTHGAYKNDKPMHGTRISFAQVLKEKLGYHTSCIGKFCLNGSGKDPTAFGSPRNRSFEFDETKYLWNRGHWKYLTENEDGEVQGYRKKIVEMFSNQTGAYTTEFLADRALNFIDERNESDQPFALMLSLPDPHGPNFVHAPYNEMFNDLVVDLPLTAEEIMNRKNARPK